MNTTTYLKWLILLPAISLAQQTKLPTKPHVSFLEVWNKISSQSPAKKAAEELANAQSVAKENSQLHWLPHFYIGASLYSTNDPGSSFFGLLEQRSVNQQDFNPGTLNSPGTNNFSIAKIGAEWAIYEGGMKAAYVDLQTHLARAAEEDLSKTTLELYIEVAKTFESLVIQYQQQMQLEDLKLALETIKKSYKLGDKSNLVGYSGLLGLKALTNKIEGLLTASHETQIAYRNGLKALGYQGPIDWLPELSSVTEFANAFFRITDSEKITSYSQKVAVEKSQAALFGAEMEKARNRPRLAIFGEGQKFSGNRQTDGATTLGISLQWNLFDPNDLGKTKEARLRALAAESYSKALQSRDTAEVAGLTSATNALKENLKLLENTEQIMIEQTKIAEQLFRNGSINALQLVEVLARRLDLITSNADLKTNYLKTQGDLLSHASLPLIANKVTQ